MVGGWLQIHQPQVLPHYLETKKKTLIAYMDIGPPTPGLRT